MEDVTLPEDHVVEELRGLKISSWDTGRMLGAGWLLYLCSLILNLLYYKMHPSSPELGTWGAAEELEEWTPLVKLEMKDEEGELELKLRILSHFSFEAMKLPEGGEISETNTKLTLEKGEFEWKTEHLVTSFFEENNLPDSGEIQSENIEVDSGDRETTGGG